MNTRKIVAAAAGVGERTYDAGKLILDAAKNGEIPQDVVDNIRNGSATIHGVGSTSRLMIGHMVER